jgi:hypothetical protein
MRRNWFPPAVAGAGFAPVAVTYVGAVGSSSDSSSYTFSAEPIGATADNRVIVVTVHGERNGSAPTLTGVTLDGNAMTNVITEIYGSKPTTAAIFMLPWPTGTTAEFIVTWSSTQLRAAIAVYQLSGAVEPVVYGTPASTSGTTANLSVTLSAQPIGVAFVAANTNESTGAGLSGDIVEDVAGTVEGMSRAAGSYETTVAEDVTVTESDGAGADKAICLAAFWSRA